MARTIGIRVLVLALALLPVRVQAQGMGSVAGRVVDAATQQPLGSVQVFVAGTSRGTLTDSQGRYRLADLPAGEVSVQAQRVGYSSATERVRVASGQVAGLDLRLSPSAVALDAIVVTGTAGPARRGDQPAVVSTVRASEVVDRGGVSNVTELLTARIPGVQITQAGGSVGSAQQIRVRGAASIALSNEPIVFIDGVRANSRMVGAMEVGGQSVSRLQDLNAEDIESIEVVKGPAAATLYGADASAGVIQIITKKGFAGEDRFRQSVSAEYGSSTADFTPPANFGVCDAALVAAGSANDLCRGKTVGTVVEDNPLLRVGALREGAVRSFDYSASGGGQDYGYYVSLGVDREEGVLPTNSLARETGRLSFRFAPAGSLVVDAGLGLHRSVIELPINDSHAYGWMYNAYMGSPTTVGAANDGFAFTGRGLEALSAIETEMTTTRYTPTVQVEHSPASWFNHRLVVGADLSRGDASQYFPKNSGNHYIGVDNTGRLSESRNNFDSYTLDYLGTVRSTLGRGWTSDLAFGAQVISQRADSLVAEGTGFVTNANRVMSAAARIEAARQGFAEDRSVGLLAQWSVALDDRFSAQLGARVDRHSSFGSDAEPFFLPKVGVSYSVSNEPFWQPFAAVVPTLRLRAAYGTTGRAPRAGAALETYRALPYVVDGGTVGSGVTPLNPGNPDLRPEKGTEIEAGVDAGFFSDRLGVELTYFRKTTTDLLLQRPVAPSSGYAQGAASQPYVNIGEVLNEGVEYSVRGSLVKSPRLAWDAWVAGSTLKNELVDLGDVSAFGGLYRFTEGRPLGAFFTRAVRSTDVASGRVVVSDTTEFAGQILPKHEGHVGSTLTFGGVLELSGQLDWKTGFKVYNTTANYRDRMVGNSRNRMVQDALSPTGRLERFGPFVSESGANVIPTSVHGHYLEDGDFLRLREMSATLRLPRAMAERLHAEGASLTLAGRNLAIWTNYSGSDPEVLAESTRNDGVGTFQRADFFSLPQPRRLLVKLNLTF